MTPDERLDAIIQLKLAGTWRHYDSVRELAATWSCNRREVERASSEADRCIARMFPAGSADEREAARGRLLAEVDRHLEAATTAGKHGEGQYGAVAQLFKLKMALSGLGAPSKSADAGQPAAGDDAYAKLPPRERVRILEEALAVERSRVAADGGNNEGDGRH